MEIKITIEDIEENELRTYGRLAKVFTHLLGESTVGITPSLEGEESTEAVEDQPSRPKNKKLPCAWCSRNFKTPAQLNKHFGFCSKNPNNEKSTDEPQRQCTMCSATETPQWRRMTEHDGILCNACAMTIRRKRTSPKAKQSNPFTKAKSTSPQRQRIIKVDRPKNVPTFSRMDANELRDAVASYVSGNNGVILGADRLAEVLMGSLEKRFTFLNSDHKEAALRGINSQVSLQFRYLEEALKNAKLPNVTFILDTKRYTMMIHKSDGNFDVDDIREMLTQ